VDTKTFLENFGVIADAPNGIAQLREVILSLAISGSLTSSKIDSWKKTTLGNEVEIVRGITFPASAKERTPRPGRVACLRTANVQSEVDWEDLLYVSEDYVRKPEQFVQLNDLLISMANSRELVGKVALVRDLNIRCTLGGFIAAIRCKSELLPKFLMSVLRIPKSREQLIDSSTQTTNIANISLGRIRPFELLLPPIDEQGRIVAKVDELMALCDELEAEKAKQEALRSAARDSAIDAISTATTPEELETAWSRISNNWESIADSTESVDSLRSLILELAIKGQLVEQINEDGTASDLLEEIQVRRNVMSKPKSISKTNQGNSFLEINPELPKNWTWTKLAEIGLINPRNSADDQVQAGFIPMAQISERFSRPHTFDIRPWSEIKKGYTHVQNGDVVVAKITPCFENGKATVIEGLPNSIGAGTTEIHVVRPILVKPEYILLFLNSPFFVVNGIPKMTGTAGQKRLPSEYISNFPFPLPPLGEQERIIEKVNNLMHLCEEIEACLRLRTEIESAFSGASSQLLTV
jgi:type I restriction enzyme S subunit